ncbi:hypothetical protein RRG08_055546 [Elysia crispata]|uniref:Uncharacterized protein n=1 Tax=Elysia crispata TaxID=231223 RepID=A0AAE1DX89_9GAST|nr:hypothetical protein RRG08_055546 [Elysia crispata]
MRSQRSSKGRFGFKIRGHVTNVREITRSRIVFVSTREEENLEDDRGHMITRDFLRDAILDSWILQGDPI